MPAKKVAKDGTTCGGAIIASAINTFVNNLPVALDGDSIVSHGTNEHAAATVIASTLTVFAEGKKVVRSGDSATCGHTVDDATCSQDVFAGD